MSRTEAGSLTVFACPTNVIGLILLILDEHSGTDVVRIFVICVCVCTCLNFCFSVCVCVCVFVYVWA